MTHTRYLRKFSIYSIGIVVTIVLLNLFVDPYDIHRLVSLPGVNAVKPEFRKHTYMCKTYAVNRLRPQTIILGTSRVENGLDPLHPGWQHPPVYNLGLSGSNIYEALRYYQHAYATRPLKEVVIGLDLIMFNSANKKSANFTEERLLTDRCWQPQPRYDRDRLTSLITFSALSDSIDTLFRQSSASNELFLPMGQRDPTYHYHRTRKYGGCRKRFIKSARVYLGTNNLLFSSDKDRSYFSEDETGRSTFDAYRALLRHAYTHHVRIHCFISPVHAWYWEIIRLQGMWPLWETWKKELVRINEEEARAAGKEPFLLWDFSGYNVFTTEPVPPLEDADTGMQWHWEAAHYKKELGDRVLNAVLGDKGRKEKAAPEFGVILNSAVIEQHLGAIIDQQQRYRPQAATDIELLEKMRREQAGSR